MSEKTMLSYIPPNPSTAWDDAHTLYLAATGGGKSQMMSQNPAIPKKGARVILWDHVPDQTGLHFFSKAKFVAALRAGIKSGKGFRVGYSGPRTIENYEWFCEVVWRSLDGRVATYCLVEELAVVSPHPGVAPPCAQLLLNEGRKYGLHWHGTSQKPQEISKTYYTACRYKFIGWQNGLAMRKKMAAEIGITPEEIATLEPLEFYRHDGSARAPERLKIKPKNIPNRKMIR